MLHVNEPVPDSIGLRGRLVPTYHAEPVPRQEGKAQQMHLSFAFRTLRHALPFLKPDPKCLFLSQIASRPSQQYRCAVNRKSPLKTDYDPQYPAHVPSRLKRSP